MKKYNWALLGTGVIAREMADALNRVNHSIYAVYNRSQAKADAFAAEYGITQAYSHLDAVLNDPEVDIVYVATPHNLHYEFMLKAIAAGKHVLCEKVITVNAAQLDEVVALAQAKGVVLAEAMTIYHMPLYKRLKEIVKSGAIGPVKLVQVNFGSCKTYDVTNRFFNTDLAGGALLDIGVYATSFARYFMEGIPDTIKTMANYFETGVDEQSGIIMRNADSQMAVMALTMRAKQPKRGVISGELGYIEVNNYPRADRATITYTADGRVEELHLGDTALALDYEVCDMQDYIANMDAPAVKAQLQDAVDVTHLLNEIREQWGFVYPFEERE